jgi:caa(3)-type oxidase subunit IV
MSTEHAASTRVYYVIFLVLLACTYLTWQVAYFDLGPLNTLAALAIAILQTSTPAVLHARPHQPPPDVAVVHAGVFWLLILLTLTASDYLTRNWT